MAEANMARNGKFGRGLSGWTTSGVELSNNQGMNGSKCAKYTFENLYQFRFINFSNKRVLKGIWRNMNEYLF